MNVECKKKNWEYTLVYPIQNHYKTTTSTSNIRCTLEERWVWQNISDTVILFKLPSVAFVEITVTHCDFAWHTPSMISSVRLRKLIHVGTRRHLSQHISRTSYHFDFIFIYDWSFSIETVCISDFFFSLRITCLGITSNRKLAPFHTDAETFSIWKTTDNL